MRIEILKNGVLERELDLQDGTYSVGRSGGSDIVLEHGDISRKHASLVIQGDKCRLEDAGSTNGIYCNGKKTKKVTLSSGKTADLGIYTMRCVMPSAREMSAAEHEKSGVFSRVVSARPVAAASVMLSLLLVGVSFFWISVGTGRIRTLAEQYEMNRATLIARAVTEMNRNAFGQTDASLFRIMPFEKEKGVVSIYIADRHGGIVAPIDQIDHAIEHPALDRAIRTGETQTVMEPSGRVLLFYPCVLKGTVSGVTLLTYSLQRPTGAVQNMWLFFLAALLVLAIVSFVGTRFIMGILQKPLSDMADAMESALRDRDAVSMDVPAPYRELEKIKFVFEKLLVRLSGSDAREKPGNFPANRDTSGTISEDAVEMKRRTVEDQGREDASWQPDSSSIVPPVPGIKDEQADVDGLPACMIELSTHNITWWSDEFAVLFDVTGAPPRHFLEIIKEPDILSAVTGIISGDAGETTVNAGGVVYRVSGQPLDSGQGQRIRLLFRQEA
jgi:hypothetical protein